MFLLNLYRSLPFVKGKMRFGSLIFRKKLNQKQPVSFKGKFKIKYTVPNTIEAIGKELIINGVFEKETIKLIKNNLKKDSVFFDVGANIGSISMPIAKTTNAEVHAFEPSRFSFRFLEKNVHDNNLKNINLNNCAIHSEDGLELQFYESEEKYGNSSLSSTYSNQPHYVVKTVSLDAYCKRNEISKINVLKIDVQGFEIEVLKGAITLLQNKAVNYIIFEMEEWAESQAKFRAGASQEFLLQNGYEIFTLQNRKLDKVITSGSHMFLAKPKPKS